MSDDITTSMLVVRISNETDLPEAVVQRIILRMSKEMKDSLLRRESVELEGIGTFIVRDVNKPVTLPGHEPREYALRPLVLFDADKVLRDLAGRSQSPTHESPAYQSYLFTDAECDEIRRQISSNEDTIKGLARKLGTSKFVIRRIVRAQVNHSNQQPKEEDE